MATVQGNLLNLDQVDLRATNPPKTDGQLQNVDLVAMCMALHHIDDLELAKKRLAERLRPVGVLLIIDWATKAAATGDDDILKADHRASHPVPHNSFKREQISGLLARAGCGEADWVLADRLSDVFGADSGKMQLFWGRAPKFTA